MAETNFNETAIEIVNDAIENAMSESTDDNEGLSTGVKIGMGVGATAIIAGGIALIRKFRKKASKSEKDDETSIKEHIAALKAKLKKLKADDEDDEEDEEAEED